MGCQCNCLNKKLEGPEEDFKSIIKEDSKENEENKILSKINLDTEFDNKSNLSNEEEDINNLGNGNTNPKKSRNIKYRKIISYDSSLLSKLQEQTDSIFEFFDELRTKPEDYEKDAEEHQLSEGLPSILWADFGVTGDFTTVGGLFYPLNSWNGCITSGHFWYGFYGRKGFPIYTNFSVNNENNITLEKVEKMEHDGRFNQETKLSGCIFRCSSYSFFYEHPEPLNPISDNFRKRLLLLPKFSIEKSLANFYPGLVKEKNEQIEKLIKSFY